MGRPRKTLEELKKSGSYRPGKHGDRAKENRPSSAPTARVMTDDVETPPTCSKLVKPENLDSVASECWDHVVGQLGSALFRTDEKQLEQLCRWYSRWKACEVALNNAEAGSVAYSRLIKDAAAASAAFDRIARRFGLTPADRDAVPVPKQPLRPMMTRPPCRFDPPGEQGGKPEPPPPGPPWSRTVETAQVPVRPPTAFDRAGKPKSAE
jgi:phage terminase small subunit